MEPLRLGIVGLNFGGWICRELASGENLPVKLVKICDLDAEKARKLSEEIHIPTSPSLDALLADPEVDAIGLYVGPNGRANLVRKIIRAGKDVMTTKPFEVSAEETLSVLREARSMGRVVHLNSPNPRPFGELKIIKEWVDSGLIGRPTVAQASTWAYYGPADPDGTWYDDPVRCPVAPLFRLGIYPLNSLLSIFGEPDTVQVTHSRVETRRPTPDNASMTIGFKSGAVANIVASFVVGGPDRYKNTMQIGGTKGVIYYAVGPRPRMEGPSANLILSTDDQLEYRVVTEHAGQYDWEFFVKRVRGEEKEDITTPEEVAAAVRVVQAMSKAELSGETVKVSG